MEAVSSPEEAAWGVVGEGSCLASSPDGGSCVPSQRDPLEPEGMVQFLEVWSVEPQGLLLDLRTRQWE